MKLDINTVLDAIEKNGFKQGFNHYIRGKGGHFISDTPNASDVGTACAIGQGAINLQVTPITLASFLKIFVFDEPFTCDSNCGFPHGYSTPFYAITHLNDEHRMPVPEIARAIKNHMGV